MWLAESEPESFLQHELNFSGDVATEHPGDLRGPGNQLRQSEVGAAEIEVPKLYGWSGADIFACQGLY